MLPRHERRRLEEIEQRLQDEDPDFARRIAEGRPLSFLRGWLSGRTGIALFAGVLAVVCLFLGAETGFLTAAVLSAVLLVSRRWDLRTS